MYLSWPRDLHCWSRFSWNLDLIPHPKTSGGWLLVPSVLGPSTAARLRGDLWTGEHYTLCDFQVAFWPMFEARSILSNVLWVTVDTVSVS